jgi:hypothetical protein
MCELLDGMEQCERSDEEQSKADQQQRPPTIQPRPTLMRTHCNILLYSSNLNEKLRYCTGGGATVLRVTISPGMAVTFPVKPEAVFSS